MEITNHRFWPSLLTALSHFWVTGVLLNEGRWKNYDVMALLAEARADLPDAHAAVALTKKLSSLLPELKVELGPSRKPHKGWKII